MYQEANFFYKLRPNTVQHAYSKHAYNELTDISKQFLTYTFVSYLFHYKHLCIL